MGSANRVIFSEEVLEGRLALASSPGCLTMNLNIYE